MSWVSEPGPDSSPFLTYREWLDLLLQGVARGELTGYDQPGKSQALILKEQAEQALILKEQAERLKEEKKRADQLIGLMKEDRKVIEQLGKDLGKLVAKKEMIYAPAVPPGVHITTAKRIGDAERNAALAWLEDALADGCIDLAEWEARSDAALKAKVRSELDALTTDLISREEKKEEGKPVSTVDRIAGRVVTGSFTVLTFAGMIAVTAPLVMVVFGIFAVIWLTMFIISLNR